MKSAGAQENLHVLLVDDEPLLLQMMRIYLQRLGYSVITSGSTDEAAALAGAGLDHFAIAVIDASMDGMSMQELALRLLEANPSLRVLAASGYPVDMSALEAAAPGRVGFLHKPFPPEMLAATIRSMLAAETEKEGL
jgi:two-component system, cell cycle sensor histidine kinase and response regulator CckA